MKSEKCYKKQHFALVRADKTITIAGGAGHLAVAGRRFEGAFPLYLIIMRILQLFQYLNFWDEKGTKNFSLCSRFRYNGHK